MEGQRRSWNHPIYVSKYSSVITVSSSPIIGSLTGELAQSWRVGALALKSVREDWTGWGSLRLCRILCVVTSTRNLVQGADGFCGSENRGAMEMKH